MSFNYYLSLPIMALLMVIQSTILPRFPIFVMVPQLELLAALAWGLLRGPNEGVVWAFVGGVLFDLFSTGPMGATPLALMAAVLIVSFVQANLPPNRLLWPIFLGGLGTLVYLLLYSGLARLLGKNPAGISNLSSIILLHALFMLPIYWPLVALNNILNPRRVEM